MLRNQGISEEAIRDICSRAKNDIDLAIADIVESRTQDAINIGEYLGIDNIRDSIVMERIEDYQQITTSNGTADFSTPPFPMMPKLLKEAYTAKDGSSYKRIPIAARGQSEKRDAYISIFEAQQALDKNNTDTLKQRRQEWLSKKNETRMASLHNIKTISSKQGSSSWKHPGVNRDMTKIMHDINMHIMDDIRRSVDDIVRRYGEV
jgi:hypothetical protein